MNPAWLALGIVIGWLILEDPFWGIMIGVILSIMMGDDD